MSKVTSKLQLTLPRALARQFGIEPGDDLTWLPSGDSLRLLPTSAQPPPMDPARRLQLFDAATARQKKRDRLPRVVSRKGRGWAREELYDRGRSR